MPTSSKAYLSHLVCVMGVGSGLWLLFGGALLMVVFGVNLANDV